MNTSARFRYRILAFLALTVAWSSVQGQEGVRLGASFYRYREDAGKAVVTVFRGSDTSGAVTVDYATEDITAIAGHDYTGTSGSLTLGVGEHRKRIEIPLAPDDTEVEPSKTFRITLSNIQGGPAGSTLTAIVQIDDDDTALLYPATWLRVDQADGHAVVRVAREGGLDREVSVQFQTASEPWQAQAGRDFEPRSGRLVFAQGQTEQTVEIPLLQSDGTEAEKQFVVRFEDPRGEALLLAGVATVVIHGSPTPLREMDLGLGTLDMMLPSPDGALLLTAGYKGAFVWETVTGKLLQRFPLPGPPVPWANDDWDQRVAATWSPDMSQIAASTGRAIYLWDRASGALLKTMVLQDGWEHSGGRPSLGFSSDGKLLAHGSLGSVDLWSLERPGTILVKPDRALGVGAIGFYGAAQSPDGRRAAVAGSYGAGLWNLESGTLLRLFDVGSLHGSPVFSGDGQSVALLGGYSVRLFDLGTGRLASQLPSLASPSLSHDGRRLAGVHAVSRPYEARVYETSTGQVRFTLPLEDYGWAVITPDGARVLVTDSTTDASGVRHTQLMLFDVATSAKLWSREGIIGLPSIAPDGTVAVLVRNGQASSILHAYELSSGDRIFEASFPGSWGWPKIGGFTPDGKRFLVGTMWLGADPDLLCIFNLDEQRLEHTWERLVHTWPYSCGWSADGSQFIEMGSDRILHRDAATGAVVREVALAKVSMFSQVRQVAFSSSDAELLVVDHPWNASGSPRAMVVDVLTGEVQSQVDADQLWVANGHLLCSDFSPDDGSTLTVRDAGTLQILHVSHYPGSIRGVALSADSRLLALSHDREPQDYAVSATTSLLIDLENGAELWRREEDGWNANAVAGILPDGSGVLLAGGCFERSMYGMPVLWDWAEDEARSYYFGNGGVWDLRMSPDGSAILVSYGAGTGCTDGGRVSHLALWDVHRGELKSGFMDAPPDFPWEDGGASSDSASSPDGRWTAIATEGCTNHQSQVLLRDTETSVTIWSSTTSICSPRMLFSPDSQWLLLAGYDGLEVREAGVGRVVTQRTGGRFRIGDILGFESSTRYWTQSSYAGDITRLWDLSDFLGPRLRYERAGDTIQLHWDLGRLQLAPSLSGPWTDLPATSPLPLSPSGDRGYFRVKVEE